MMRTASTLILAAVLGITGALVATADMDTPSSAFRTVSVVARSMNPAEVAASLDMTVAPSSTSQSAKPAAKKGLVTTARIKQIRAWAGMPPCRYEDGSGQALPCYWNAKVRGNGKGRSFIAVTPAKKGDDPRIILLPKN